MHHCLVAAALLLTAAVCHADVGPWKMEGHSQAAEGHRRQGGPRQYHLLRGRNLPGKADPRLRLSRETEGRRPVARDGAGPWRRGQSVSRVGDALGRTRLCGAGDGPRGHGPDGKLGDGGPEQDDHAKFRDFTDSETARCGPITPSPPSSAGSRCWPPARRSTRPDRHHGHLLGRLPDLHRRRRR